MARQAPPASVGDDEPPAASTAKSAEDRKAASALANLDASHDDAAAASTKNVDREAIHEAMKRLGGAAAPDATDSTAKAKAGSARAGSTTAMQSAAKSVKVDAADVALLVDELEISRLKATELLKAHAGNVVGAMTWFITPPWLR